LSKKSVFSWQIIEFLNNLLEFFENLLEFFFGLSFFGLEFFSKCPKKSLSSDVATILATIPLQHYNYTFGIYTLLRHLFLYDDDMMF